MFLLYRVQWPVYPAEGLAPAGIENGWCPKPLFLLTFYKKYIKYPTSLFDIINAVGGTNDIQIDNNLLV